jgi:hypothetical protein
VFSVCEKVIASKIQSSNLESLISVTLGNVKNYRHSPNFLKAIL